MSFAQTQTEPAIPAALSSATAFASSSSSSSSLSSPPSLSPPTVEYSTLLCRQFVGGSIGGVMLVLTGHPLDTIKIRMQSGEYATVGGALRGVFFSGRTAGGLDNAPLPLRQRVASLYRGASILLTMQGFYSATLFGFNGVARTLLTPYFPDKEGSAATGGGSRSATQQQPPLMRVLAAAVITAPVHTALMTPLDVVKVRLQALHKKGAYSGPIDCVRCMLREGGEAVTAGVGMPVGEPSSGRFSSLKRAQGLFAGYGAYAAVRTVGFGPYFVTFEAVKNFLTTGYVTGGGGAGEKDSSTRTRSALLSHDSRLVPLIGGSCAGVAYWLAAFPLDTVKTTLQLSRSPLWEGHARRQIGSTVPREQQQRHLPQMRYPEAIRFILTDGHRQRHYSPRLLYRGLSIALIRAMPANAAMFFGVKETEKFMIRNGW